jgi:hypothetical protein
LAILALSATFFLGDALTVSLSDADAAVKPKKKTVKKVKVKKTKSIVSCAPGRSSSLSDLPPNVARDNGPFDRETAEQLYMYGRMPYGGIVDTTYHPEAHQQRER